MAIAEEFSRSAMLMGDDAVERLRGSSIAVFGLGGVGGQCAEALCRAGVGRLLLIDGDEVSRSNINRQIIATQDTIGRRKTDVCRERLHSIYPDTVIEVYDIFYDASTADSIDLSRVDCVVDAIDTVSSKLLLIERAAALGVPTVSCMGAGNKLDPSRFRVSDIYQTSVCPLAKVMRTELRRRGIKKLRVVWSDEPPVKPKAKDAEDKDSAAQTEVRHSGRPVPGSASFCAPAAGLVIAAEAVRLVLE